LRHFYGCGMMFVGSLQLFYVMFTKGEIYEKY
jgi:hypothetical protein